MHKNGSSQSIESIDRFSFPEDRECQAKQIESTQSCSLSHLRHKV